MNGYVFSGVVLARGLAALSCLPGWTRQASSIAGRACRMGLRWRIASAASRHLASKSIAKPWGFLAASLCAAGWFCIELSNGGGLLAGAVFALSSASGFGLAWMGARPRAQESRGAMWVALASSSEICHVLDTVAAGPTMLRSAAFGKPYRALHRHPGYAELARRLSAPETIPEDKVALSSRRRLCAMALALSGSEVAARWLWRRRQAPQSLSDWSRHYCSAVDESTESWEAGHSLRLATASVPMGAGNISWGASRLSEASIPLLWARVPLDEAWLTPDFNGQIRREVLAAACGISPASWGWRQDKEAQWARQNYALMAPVKNSKWAQAIEQAPSWFEREKIEQSAAVCALDGRPAKRL